VDCGEGSNISLAHNSVRGLRLFFKKNIRKGKLELLAAKEIADRFSFFPLESPGKQNLASFLSLSLSSTPSSTIPAAGLQCINLSLSPSMAHFLIFVVHCCTVNSSISQDNFPNPE